MLDRGKPLPGPGTVVGANVKLTGVLKDFNEITVHGQVDGEVISEKNVLVAETASIKGPVSAKTVIVAGRVTGAINALEKLEILPTGKVSGSISTRDLIIRSGAFFNGKSTMLTEEGAKKAARGQDEKTGTEKKIIDEEEKKYEIE